MHKTSDAFLRCERCRKVIFAKEFYKNLRVCPHCKYHHRLPAEERIAATFDPESFQELDQHMRSCDPLEFPEYQEKLQRGFQATQRFDSVIRGYALLSGIKVSTAVADFRFMGGSMGSVAGEKIARTLELSADEHIPCVIFTATGGARMQEGLISLMQMAKTAGACYKLRQAGVPFICIFTDPTMAGVLASYASLADIILAEPGALVGFAGQRVSAQAGVERVPDNFQTAEFNYQHGMIDLIVERKDIRPTLTTLLHHFGGKP